MKNQKHYPPQRKFWSFRVSIILMFLLCFNPNLKLSAQTASDINAQLDACNVNWDVPGPSDKESMPLGNGDIGLNVWVETNGDLLFYISKSDSWSEDYSGLYGLPKIGKIRVSLSPQPGTGKFSQIVKLRTGEIVITYQDSSVYRVWVDANNQVIRVEATTAAEVTMTVAYDYPRTGIAADITLTGQANKIVWYHRNPSGEHPTLIKDRTFGALVKGAGLVTVNSKTLQSSAPSKTNMVSIIPLTTTVVSANEWLKQINALATSIDNLDLETTRTNHQTWWIDFWNRSYIYITGDKEAENVTKGYALQRFMTACMGRGAQPIKFNGGLFTVNYFGSVNRNEDFPPDRREWGGQYWFQNTRAMYWPRLAAGDFEMMKPLFDMYLNETMANKTRVQQLYGHGGSYFAETKPFWGGLDDCSPSLEAWYTRHYFCPILEIGTMMWDYYSYTEDDSFAASYLVPLLKEAFLFYDSHFSRVDGKLFISPANSIETHWKVQNPAPDIAGLRYLLPRMIGLPSTLVDNKTKVAWQNLLDAMPAIPVAGGKLLAYSGVNSDSQLNKNSENPELYSVFPQRLYGLLAGDNEIALASFKARKNTWSGCWSQDPVHAAMVGATSDAKFKVNYNFTYLDPQLKFPAFWNRKNDHAPDMDNGGMGELGLQKMIMQTEGQKILLLPACPKGWTGNFKLNAPMQTTVQGTFTAKGEIINLVVTPSSRTEDVAIIAAPVNLNRDGWVVTASEGNAPSDAIDGSTTTRWSTETSQRYGQWFKIDMGYSQTFDGIVLDQGQWTDDYPRGYLVYVSADGINWGRVIARGAGAKGLTEIYFDKQTARYIRIVQTGSSGLYWGFADVNVSSSVLSQTPYGGTALEIPGTIEAEDFDNGGQGVSYFDKESDNLGGQYRTNEWVDVETCSEGGYNVGSVNQGEWMEYTVNVVNAGFYNFDVRAAATSGSSVHIEFNGENKTGTINVPNSGAGQTYQNAGVTGIYLKAGVQVMKLFIESGNCNINNITVIAGATAINDLNSKAGEQSVSIYPNPLNQNILTIKLEGFKNSDNSEVRITNSHGQVVYQNHLPLNKTLELSTSVLQKSSVYFVSVKSGQSIVTKKLVVQ